MAAGAAQVRQGLVVPPEFPLKEEMELRRLFLEVALLMQGAAVQGA